MIKKLFLLSTFLLLSLYGFSQPDYKKLVKNLKHVKSYRELAVGRDTTIIVLKSHRSVGKVKYAADPGVGKDSVFWDIVSRGKEIVPFLIEEIPNIRKTSVTSLLNCPGEYLVGDLAIAAIMEIINLPAYDIMGILPGKDEQYYKAFWNDLHVRYKRNKYFNRGYFQKMLRQWYDDNADKLEWIESQEALHIASRNKPGYITGYYVAPKPVLIEASDDEAILIDHFLMRMDKNSSPIYLIEDFYEGAKFVEWELNSIAGYDKFKEAFDDLKFGQEEYREENSDKNKWSLKASIFQKNQFCRFQIIPEEKWHEYLYGLAEYPAGNVYTISKPLYSKDGSYAYVEAKYSPRSHGRWLGSLILKKSENGWELFMRGPTLIE